MYNNLNLYFPEELPRLGVQYSPSPENKEFDAFHAEVIGGPNG